MTEETNIIYKSYPKTVSDAVKQLISVVSEKEKEEIRNTPKEELVNQHFGLILWIRNNFALLHQNQKLLDSCKLVAGYQQSFPMDPDLASSIIIEALWENLKE